MQFTLYIFLLFLLVCLLLFLLHRSSMPSLTVLLALTSFALLGMVLELAFVSFPIKLFFNQLKLLGVFFIAPAVLLLYLQFLKLDRFCTRRNVLILCIIPALTVPVLLTNHWHQLFFTETYIMKTSLISYVYFAPSTWFWFYSIYSYLIVLAAIVILVIGCFRKPDIYRGQNYVMLFGVLVAVVLNGLVIFGAAKDYGDLSIVAFALVAACHYWGIFVYKPVRMITLARSFAVTEINNPILIFDNNDQLIDSNLRAHDIFGIEKATEELRKIQAGEFVYKENIYSVTEKKLYNNGNVYIGRAVVFDDITKIKASVEKLEFIISHDPLTGMKSRSAFEKELQTLKRNAALPISLIHINICGMKVLNNVFGYEFGDTVIQAVGELILDEFGNHAITSRMNGDEFAIALPNTDAAESLTKLQSLNERCQALAINSIFIGLYAGIETITDVKFSMNYALKNVTSYTYRNKLTKSRGYYIELFQSFESALKSNQYETTGHVERTIRLCEKLSVAYQLPEEKAKQLTLLALTHDIGLLNMSTELVEKIGTLSNDEWEEFKLHTERGYNIALISIELSPIANDILHHHERFDGYGYPSRLKGTDIPLFARIIAVVDFYDNLLFPRENNKPQTHEQAIVQLRTYAGTRYDPDIVETFISILV